MTIPEAKKLKPRDRIRWTPERQDSDGDPPSDGTIMEATGFALSIRWDDGIECVVGLTESTDRNNWWGRITKL